MKKLLLMRHAKSSWNDPNQNDFDRPLNERGLDTAPKMGQFLTNQNHVPDHIISSAAKRAKSTARLLAEHCGYTKKLIYCQDLYLASADTYFHLIHQQPENINTLLMVGHNPILEDFIYSLTKKSITLTTANIVCFHLDISSWNQLSKNTILPIEHIWRPKEIFK